MIKMVASLERRGELYQLTVTADGHAGYDVEGRDIVCASISTIMECIRSITEARHPQAVSDGRSGHIDVVCQFSTREAALQAFVDVFPLVEVAEDLANHYPDYVSVDTINHCIGSC